MYHRSLLGLSFQQGNNCADSGSGERKERSALHPTVQGSKRKRISFKNPNQQRSRRGGGVHVQDT
jgi:hypothetical protein